MIQPDPARLVLDEMFAPAIALSLRDLKHDVVAVVERVDLRSISDDELFAWTAAERRWLVTENVKDFRPILLRALQTGGATAGLLFTSSRTFQRSRHNPGPLIDALDAWLATAPKLAPITEDWLMPKPDRPTA